MYCYGKICKNPWLQWRLKIIFVIIIKTKIANPQPISYQSDYGDSFMTIFLNQWNIQINYKLFLVA